MTSLWPQADELERNWLLSQMPVQSVCAEIGVHCGDFSEQILEIVKPKKLHLIDPWFHQEEPIYRGSWYGGLGSPGQKILDNRFENVLARFDRQIQSGQVVVHRLESETASHLFDDAYFDWVYIDGNHLYEYVKSDLVLYRKKIKAGGLLTGDDYGLEGWWGNGVQKAVDEYLRESPELNCEICSMQYIISNRIHESST